MEHFEGLVVNGSGDFTKGGRPPPTSPAAKARSAAALRENLQRRKAQARGQQEQAQKPEDEPKESEG